MVEINHHHDSHPYKSCETVVYSEDSSWPACEDLHCLFYCYCDNSVATLLTSFFNPRLQQTRHYAKTFPPVDPASHYNSDK